MKRIKAMVFMLCALALSIVAALTFYSTIHALANRDTLTAIESGFGSGVIAILMFALAVRLFRRGRLLLRENTP